MQYASLLIFPSHGPESLSRVLLEASALGVPIAAMDTGGTRDIVVHGETGLISQSAEALGEDVRRLRDDERRRGVFGQAARRRVERLFDAGVVLDRLEALYGDLLRRQSPTR
jgi:glycosyltransferase involved in cell wall biosynthesis